MKTVVVLCVPRSGSSLLSGVLHRLGVWMGKKGDLKRGRRFNKYGCYENQEILSFCYSVLAAADSFYYPAKKINYIKVKKTVQRFIPKFKQIIKNYARDLWGWKVPQYAYIAPYTHKYLTNPYYIILKRDIDRIIDSQIKVNSPLELFLNIMDQIHFLNIKLVAKLAWGWFKIFLKQRNPLKERETIRKAVLDSYKHIESFTKKKKKITVKLEELINNSEIVINRLIKFLGIKPSKKQKQEALSFIHPELIHV